MRVRWGRVLVGLLFLAVLCFLVSTGAIILSGLAERGAQEATDGPEVPAGQDGFSGWSEEDGAGDGAEEPAAADAPDGDDPGDAGAPDDAGDAAAGAGAAAEDAGAGLPPFTVLTLQYAPYMATLAHMDAGGYLEERGYDLRLIDVYDPEVDLDEDGQCQALQDGRYDALATTLDATRKCGQGVAVAIPIGQSAGNDAIIVKPGVETWADIFDHAIAFTDGSVSQYMACFASHTAAVPMRVPVRHFDAAEAVDAWANSGVEQDIASVVAWEPEVSRALAEVPGSQVILSSEDVRILWDVIEFSTELAAADPARFQAFTDAYYEALRDLTNDPGAAFARIDAWAGDDEARRALLTAESAEDFRAQLELEAFATLRDAAFLMDGDRATLKNRLDEAAFYWRYCDVDVPDVADLDALILPDYVLAADAQTALRAPAARRPGSLVFQVTDFTDASVVHDADIDAKRLLFETGLDIEFLPNQTAFRDPQAAEQILRDAVRFLRTCQDCVLEVQGSSAFPGGAFRRTFTQEDADQLAIARGQRVYDSLIQLFDVPEAQLVFVEEPRQRLFPGSVVEEELRQDRRTYLTGYQLAGGM